MHSFSDDSRRMSYTYGRSSAKAPLTTEAPLGDWRATPLIVDEADNGTEVCVGHPGGLRGPFFFPGFNSFWDWNCQRTKMYPICE